MLSGAMFADLLGHRLLKHGSIRIASNKLFPKCLNLGKLPKMPTCELPDHIRDHLKKAILTLAKAHNPYHGSRCTILILWFSHSL